MKEEEWFKKESAKWVKSFDKAVETQDTRNIREFYYAIGHLRCFNSSQRAYLTGKYEEAMAKIG